jgi:rieske iron-sulfur protein
MTGKCAQCTGAIDRRTLLKAGFGAICLGAMPSSIALGQGNPASMAPQEGDQLIKVGDAELKPLSLGSLSVSGQMIMAWPMEPAAKTVRSGSRLNQVLLIRLNPADLAGEVLSNAADGVLAYSALCTHAGCNVTDWQPDTRILSCDCHSSEFDARASGRVVAGPAQHALPPLPLRLNGDVLVVAKSFATPIRFDE